MEKEDTAAAEMTFAAQKFLRDHIPAVWQLELLMFMKHSNSTLPAAAVAAHLYSNPREIEEALSRFVESGLLRCERSEPPVYCFDPESEEMSYAIEQACNAYLNKRLAVINFIFSKNDPAEQIPENTD